MIRAVFINAYYSAGPRGEHRSVFSCRVRCLLLDRFGLDLYEISKLFVQLVQDCISNQLVVSVQPCNFFSCECSGTDYSVRTYISTSVTLDTVL